MHMSLRGAMACFVALSPLWLCSHAQGASEEEELSLAFGDKATISIATGSEQALRRAPAVATVITAEDIRAMGAKDLDEVLETVPGIHVSRSVQAYAPLYFIRGVASEFNPQTLMLQNGVPMTTLFVGNRGNVWYGYPVENIARIEVIRGPGSALYGADAFSGVINIITKTAADSPGTEVGVRAGSFNTWDGWVQHGGQLGPLDVAAFVRVGQTDGFKERIDADTQTARDAVHGTQASLAPGNVNNGFDAFDGHLDLRHQKLRMRLGYKLRDRGGTGPGVSGALDPIGRAKSERVNADLSWSGLRLSEGWDVGLTASYLSYSQQFPTPLRLLPPGAVTFGGAFPNGVIGAPQTWERQLRLSVVSTYTGFDKHHIRVGFGHDDLDLYRTQEFKNFSIVGDIAPLPGGEVIEVPQADAFLVPHRRRVDYAYIQDEWRVARDWTVTGGVRHDRYSDFGGTTNPRAAIVWDASLDVTAKLLYGRAFRAPALTEQYSINNPVLRGNPNLRPETIQTVEAALAWQVRPDLDVNVSAFRYRMKDIIRTVQTEWSNTGAQHGHGLELESTWHVTRSLRLQGHYAWQQSTDEVSDEDAGYAPHHQFFAGLDWRMSQGWWLGAKLKHVARRHRTEGDTRPQIDDFTTVDLTVRSAESAGRGWEWTAAVRNLLDEVGREPTAPPTLGGSIPGDLPLAGRAFYVQASYRF